ARIADEAGVDQVVLPDHVVMGARTDRYPYGTFPYDADAPWIEPLTTLAAMASATTRVRLGTGILIAPLRPAVLLAKTIATLDVLSGGRVDLGVGVGWQREEYEALGVPFAGRWQRLDDTLGACRALWQDAPASFSSPTVAFDDIWCAPRPVQARVPVWFGAKASETLAGRIAAVGDGWYPLGNLSPDDLRYSEADERFRAELRSWLDSVLPTLPPPPPATDMRARREYDCAWQRLMFDAGYAGIDWPKEHGGRGASLTEQLVFLEETERA